MLAAVPSGQNACMSYGSAMVEVKRGRRAARAGRYATAYRHFSRGLKTIDAAYEQSMDLLRARYRGRIIDDTDLIVGKAFVENRDGQYRSASKDAESVLLERLSSIQEANRCRF